MRVATIAIAGTICAAWLATVAAALPTPVSTAPDIENVQPVAEGCGYGRHQAGGYSRHDGVWVPGSCERNP